MTYKQIEASRELRLWIGQIIVPAVGLTTTILMNPEARQAIKSRFEKARDSVKKVKLKVIKKEEEA